MRQVITTKYLAPTNHRGGRVKASCDAGSVTVAWQHEFDVAINHSNAAGVLRDKLGWDCELRGGFDRRGCGQFVQIWGK